MPSPGEIEVEKFRLRILDLLPSLIRELPPTVRPMFQPWLPQIRALLRDCHWSDLDKARHQLLELIGDDRGPGA